MDVVTTLSKVWRWLGGMVLGLALAGLGVALWRSGLEDADRWASVIGVFLNIAGLAITVASAIAARNAAKPGGDVKNVIEGGRFNAAVTQARDIGQPAGTPLPGDVSNSIRDGEFYGPVTMARDVADGQGDAEKPKS